MQLVEDFGGSEPDEAQAIDAQPYEPRFHKESGCCDDLERVACEIDDPFVGVACGVSSAHHLRKALENGAEALFTKPIDFGALRSEIDTRVERAA